MKCVISRFIKLITRSGAAGDAHDALMRLGTQCRDDVMQHFALATATGTRQKHRLTRACEIDGTLLIDAPGIGDANGFHCARLCLRSIAMLGRHVQVRAVFRFWT